MQKKKFKTWFIVACACAILGAIAFLVKIIEGTMRTAHGWAKSFLIMGFVFIGLALLILVLLAIFDKVLTNKKAKAPQINEEALLQKYRSKRK